MDANEGSGGQFNPGILEYVTVFSREPNTLRWQLRDPSTSRRLAPVPGLAALLTKSFWIRRDPGAEIARRTLGTTRPQRAGVFHTQRDDSGGTRPDHPLFDDERRPICERLDQREYRKPGCVAMPAGHHPKDLVSQLVSTRAAQTTPCWNLAWVVQILGNPASIQAGPYLTTQTYQISADVAAVGHYGRGYRRTLFVIDGSTGTPQVVYRHNMVARLAWRLAPRTCAVFFFPFFFFFFPAAI